MTKFGKGRKTGLSGFSIFRVDSRKEAKRWNLKIQVCLRHGKERRNIKEPTHVLTTKFDIMRKLEGLVSQIRTSGFYSYGMANISRWRSTLYISKVGLCRHVFRLCTCFSDNLVEFHSRNNEVLQMIKIWTKTEYLKHSWWSPHRDDQNGSMQCMI
jgi:hypothetical protein